MSFFFQIIVVLNWWKIKSTMLQQAHIYPALYIIYPQWIGYLWTNIWCTHFLSAILLFLKLFIILVSILNFFPDFIESCCLNSLDNFVTLTLDMLLFIYSKDCSVLVVYVETYSSFNFSNMICNDFTGSCSWSIYTLISVYRLFY